ncbi:MAG: 2TM domain-containing protein [Flavobacteriaceae bacterium]|nr:2TM domain-containing protein [Flavobacteriaceae bacterium]
MKNLSKKILIAFIIGTIIFIIGNYLYNDFNFESFNDFILNFSFYQLYSFVIGFSVMSFFTYLGNRKWEENERVKRIVIGITGSVIISMACLFFLRMFTEMTMNSKTFNEFIANENIKNYQFGLWISLTLVIIFHFIYFYNKYQQKKVEESQIVAKTESAKFESLKSQLDPHFLFNSLNVLTSLIDENPRQAEKFTTKLSKVYRYVLEQKDKDLIPLEEELKFAKSYMELLKMRFEDGINFNIPEKVSSQELKIAPLSLQLLLENAVKHNVITSKDPLEIKIYEENRFLSIENNINPKASLEKSTKVGLKNINQRYGLITDKTVIITNNNNIFKVKLPLLTKKITTMKTDYINDNNKYIRAKKRVEELKGFYGNVVAYCVVIPFLIFINYRTGWGHKWFFYPMFGWGIGVVIQAFVVFGYGSDWEERKIREFMKNDTNL